jgi:hypothetical protein
MCVRYLNRCLLSELRENSRSSYMDWSAPTRILTTRQPNADSDHEGSCDPVHDPDIAAFT